MRFDWKCRLFGHALKPDRYIADGVYEARCVFCKKEFFINDTIDLKQPLTDEQREINSAFINKFKENDMSIKYNLLTENWVERSFIGGPLDGTKKPVAATRAKVTHYEYGEKNFEGATVDVIEYVYRIVDGLFVNTEINGIIRKYK